MEDVDFSVVGVFVGVVRKDALFAVAIAWATSQWKASPQGERERGI